MFKFCVDKNRIQIFVIPSDISTSGSKLNSSVFISSCYFNSCGELIVLLHRGYTEGEQKPNKQKSVQVFEF